MKLSLDELAFVNNSIIHGQLAVAMIPAFFVLAFVLIL
jgi:hypothetical protein